MENSYLAAAGTIHAHRQQAVEVVGGRWRREETVKTRQLYRVRCWSVKFRRPRYTGTMSTDEHPKSALELAMERLRQRDADSGVVETQATDQQKAAIAEARSLHASKVAELEILHRAKVATVPDAAERASADEGYRRQLQRLHDDLERKLGKIRAKED